jgi:hypothetical protein
MAGANGLADCTWDSASCAFFRFGSLKVPLLKFGVPKEDIKTEKVRRIGEMRASKRTPGTSEIGDAAIEILLTDYEAFILPRLPKHGGTMVEFVITATVTHPSVKGGYGVLCDACRFVNFEGPEFDGSEKGLVKKLGVSVVDVWEKGQDGIWKTAALMPLPSSQAIPLLAF